MSEDVIKGAGDEEEKEEGAESEENPSVDDLIAAEDMFDDEPFEDVDNL
jgi:hypothetical protein